MKRSSAARRVAYGAVFSALAIALLGLSVLIPTLDLTLAAFAAICVYLVLLDHGAGTAFSVYLVVSVLSLLLLPDKSSAVFFCVLFGWYPFLRNAVSRLNLWIGFLIKLSGSLCGAAAAYLVLRFFLIDTELIEQITVPVLILVPVVLILYDLGLGKLMAFYVTVLRPKLKR